MTIEEIKEKILSIERAPGLLVDCEICRVSGDIFSGNFGVICDVKKRKATRRKNASILHTGIMVLQRAKLTNLVSFLRAKKGSMSAQK